MNTRKTLDLLIYAVLTSIALCFFAAQVVAGEIEREGRTYVERIAQSFPVDETGNFILSSHRGEIRLESWEENTVEVKVVKKVRTYTEAEAREMLDRFEVRFDHKPDLVNVETEFEDGRSRIKVSFDVKIPRKFNADLKTAGGDIEIGDLLGKIVAITAGGGIKVGQAGSSTSLRTSGGHIKVDQVEGPIEARTSGGGIYVGKAAENAGLRTSGGNIEVMESGGAISAKTSGGGIRLGDSPGPVEAATSGGNITLGDVGSDVTAKASGGGIRMGRAKGVVEAKTSGGDIRIEGAGGKVSRWTNLNDNFTTETCLPPGRHRGRRENREARG